MPVPTAPRLLETAAARNKSNGSEKTVVDKSLPIPAGKLSLEAKAEARAWRTIDDIHRAYVERGGVRELKEKLDAKLNIASHKIFMLASWAEGETSSLDEALRLFLFACERAEKRYKEEYKVDNLKHALPTWAVFKSNIKRGMEDFKLRPSDYRSEGAFRIEMQKRIQEQQRALPSPAAPIKNPKRSPKVKRIEEALASTQLHDTIRLLVSQIIFECESLKRNSRSDAEAVLRDAMNRLQPLVDPRKVA